MVKLLFTSFLLVTLSLSAQSIPSYSERNSFLITDTAITTPTNPFAFSEGKVDENSFIVGPGDKFQLSIQGLSEINAVIAVNPEGDLYIPKIGGVNIAGKPLKEAKFTVKGFINTKMKNVDIYFSLTEPRRIIVYPIGEIKNQTSLIVSARSRLSDIMNRSGFLKESSDIRNITIKNRNGTEKSVDFLQFLRNGILAANPFLMDGDIILFKKTDKFITCIGEVLYPGYYEFKSGETVAQLLELSGGLTIKAKSDSVEIIRFGDDLVSQTTFFESFTSPRLKSFELKPFDKIIIREKVHSYKDISVILEGFVGIPGPFSIVDNKTTLSEVIKMAGGFHPSASLKDAIVRRESGTEELDPEFERIKLIPRQDMTDDEYDYIKSKSRLRRGRVVVDFVQIFEKNNVKEDIVLRRGDVITIPEIKNYISLIGQVVNPGKIEIKKGWKVADYIQAAGGFAWRAEDSEIRVVRATSGEWVEADKVTELFPGDVIWIPEEPPTARFWEVTTQILTVLGQVATVVAATVAVVVSVK